VTPVWVEEALEGAREQVTLRRGSRSHLLRERMHVLETRLDPRRFARIHRSTIVNLTRVREIKHRLGGEHVVVLTDGTELKASRQRWGAFRALMRARTGRQVLE
jgi:two-component system LytT family response regulator